MDKRGRIWVCVSAILKSRDALYWRVNYIHNFVYIGYILFWTFQYSFKYFFKLVLASKTYSYCFAGGSACSWTQPFWPFLSGRKHWKNIHIKCKREKNHSVWYCSLWVCEQNMLVVPFSTKGTGWNAHVKLIRLR